MLLDFGHINWTMFLIGMFVIIWSIAIHEFAHALAADLLGDDTPRRQGRVTILPTEHFDPIGFIMIVFIQLGGLGLGWGKPVMINPGRLRHPRRDMILIAAAGPFSNLVLAVIAGLIMRFTKMDMDSSPTGAVLSQFLFINLGLMLFNLIPIPPLDGSKVLSNLLPFEMSVRYDRAMAQYGLMILLALVFLGSRTIIPELIGKPRLAIASALTGFEYYIPS